MTAALAHARIDAPQGRFYDVYNPAARPIDLGHMAQKLARIVRFNGEPGAISVAQHEVLGAEAIVNEGGSAGDAVLFLHHDDYTFALGDQVRPVQTAAGTLAPDFSGAWSALKANWERAIFAALDLPPPDAWTPSQAEAVTMMNMRMSATEKLGLYGPPAVAGLPRAVRRVPNFRSSLCPPWPPERAAEAWKAMHRKLTGRIIR